MRTLRSWLTLTPLVFAGAAAWAASGREPVTLQLKWRHQFQFAGYYAAVAQGYYRDAGLDVTLKEAQPGRDPVEAVLRGDAEYGVGTSELVLLRVSGRPVVVLADIFQHSPLVLLARRDAGVRDLQDLATKPVMIEPQSAELFAYFKYEGIDPARLRKEPHSFDVNDLIAGRVAAMSGYATDEPFRLRQAGVDFLAFTPRAGGIDFYGDTLFTTEQEIRRHPARAKAFREASLRGWEYALAHRDELIDLILREYPRGKSREHLKFEAEQTAALMHPGLIEIGHINPGRWQRIAETYAELGLIPRLFSLNGFIYATNPPAPQDLRWFYWAIVAFLLLALATLGWILPLVRLNRRLHVNERQYRELVEHAPFPVAITDLETSRVLFNNRRAVDLFGDGAMRDLSDLQATSFYENPGDRERLLTELRTKGVVNGMELRFQARDGRTIWAQLSAGLLEFAGRQAIAVSFHDITHRREMEDVLRAAKDAAESADAAKGRYLGVLSHEIRTPLNGLLGVAGLLRTEPLSAEGREHLEILERSGQTLLRLINDLLDFARYDAGSVQLEQLPLEPTDFLKELCTLFRPAAEAKGLALTYAIRPEVPALVVTDPMRLRQVLSNLLSNAIKFTAQGAVEIIVERAPFAGAEAGRCRLRFHVSDTGPGIPPEKLTHLFEPFVQADASVARRFGGTGLGLSISKRLAQLLGGGIRVQSTPGAGSMFTVEIEAEVAPAPGAG